MLTFDLNELYLRIITHYLKKYHSISTNLPVTFLLISYDASGDFNFKHLTEICHRLNEPKRNVISPNLAVLTVKLYTYGWTQVNIVKLNCVLSSILCYSYYELLLLLHQTIRRCLESLNPMDFFVETLFTPEFVFFTYIRLK